MPTTPTPTPSSRDEALAASLTTEGYAFCDSFVTREVADGALVEAQSLDLSAGEVSSEAGYWKTEKKTDRRGDMIAWLTEEELAKHSALSAVVSEMAVCVDALRALKVEKLCSVEAAKKGTLTCERVMVAHYPEAGRRFVPHVDNPNNNGRVITFTYYLNPQYAEGDGGELSILASINGSSVAEVAPLHNRMAALWSESTVHQVLPVEKPRWAVVVWFSLQSQDEKLQAMKAIFAALMSKTKR